MVNHSKTVAASSDIGVLKIGELELKLENAELKLSVEYWKRKAENKSHDGEKLVEKPLQDVRLGSAM